jgi:hypothetical protein
MDYFRWLKPNGNEILGVEILDSLPFLSRNELKCRKQGLKPNIVRTATWGINISLFPSLAQVLF